MWLIKQILPKGTVTDLDGKFRLPNLLNKTTLLFFTYVGFKNEKYVVTGNKEQIKIVMKADVSDLDEVVVVGQANQKKGFCDRGQLQW